MKFLRVEEYKDGRPVVVVEKSFFGLVRWESKYLARDKTIIGWNWLKLPGLKDFVVDASLIGNIVTGSQLNVWLSEHEKAEEYRKKKEEE